MKCWLSCCDEVMKIRMDGGAIGVQIEQQCRSAMLLIKGQCFSEYVGDHMLSKTVPDFQYVPGDHLAYEIITDVDMLCASMELIVLGYCNG